jgi:hypothetical protein
MISEALLAARFSSNGRSLKSACDPWPARMTAPGVGPIVGLTYASAIDEPGRFRSSKVVGAHFRQDQAQRD